MPAIIDPVGPPDDGEPRTPAWRRLAWFFAIAVVAMLATAALAYGLKALLPSS